MSFEGCEVADEWKNTGITGADWEVERKGAEEEEGGWWDLDSMCNDICAGKYECKTEEWDAAGPEAKTLVSCLLEVDTDKRPSAEQALSHPWLNNSGAAQVTSQVEAMTIQENGTSADNLGLMCRTEALTPKPKKKAKRKKANTRAAKRCDVTAQEAGSSPNAALGPLPRNATPSNATAKKTKHYVSPRTELK